MNEYKCQECGHGFPEPAAYRAPTTGAAWCAECGTSQAAAAARVFVKRTRRQNRDRLVNTLTQVDAQAGAELREYLADVEPTVPLSELRALVAEWHTTAKRYDEIAAQSDGAGDVEMALLMRARAGVAMSAVLSLGQLLGRYERSR